MYAHNKNFIVLEGGEGAGKTEQCERLERALVDQGYDVLRTRQPGGCPSADEIRQLLVTGEPDRWDTMSELLLFTVARRQGLIEVIMPALDEGKVVIADRFVDSTAVYQGFAPNEDPDRATAIMRLIYELHEEYCENMMPGLTLWLDIDAKAGLERSLKRLSDANSAETRFEAKDLDFHERVRQGFAEVHRKQSHLFIRLDAYQPVDEVEAHVTRTALSVLAPQTPAPAP